MANAPNRMTRRLAITIAAYIERHGNWPNEARLSAESLYWVARSGGSERGRPADQQGWRLGRSRGAIGRSETPSSGRR